MLLKKPIEDSNSVSNVIFKLIFPMNKELWGQE